jgi:hypothetical protein
MGIFANGKGVSKIYYHNIPIIRVYAGDHFVWPMLDVIDEILSCYYNGYWIDEYPWTDDTPWKD